MPDIGGGRRGTSPSDTPVLRASPADLVNDWQYKMALPMPLVQIRRARLRWNARRLPPPAVTLVPPFRADRWNALFLYAPSNAIDADQKQILSRMRALSGRLLVVVATRSPAELPPEVRCADSLIWKGLSGFDFSAYALALASVAEHSPGATLYVQNDSVFGPFNELDALVHQAPWALSGFIGSAEVEPHISSFAFVMRDVRPTTLAIMRPVLSTAWSYDSFEQVVMLQETRFARVAARAMSVGSYSFLTSTSSQPTVVAKLAARLEIGAARIGPIDARGDATLSFPSELLNRGFPFLKRSLFTKFAGLAENGQLREQLRERDWDPIAVDQAR